MLQNGHSFGNILLAELEKVTGSFAEGVEIASEILKIRGRVMPISHDKAVLAAELADGKVIEGETNIQEANLKAGTPNLSKKSALSLS